VRVNKLLDRITMSVTVLIVDDEPALNELFVIGLNKYGYPTKGVLGGKECLDILSSSFTPDLILLDMMMEPMDGWETLIRIKSMEKVQHIPVILQTGKNLTYEEAERFVGYIEDYIMKPVTPKRCIEYINETLNKVRIIQNIISQGISDGYEEKDIKRYANLYRTILVAKKLLLILEVHYGSVKSDIEYAKFLNGLENEFSLLKEKIPIQIDAS
jgi:CheY-like chemotaxis protein